MVSPVLSAGKIPFCVFDSTYTTCKHYAFHCNLGPYFQMIRVLLVDDHPVARPGYKRLLETNSAVEVVAEASEADSAYLAFVVYKPDITVLDLSMPGVTGLSLLQEMLLRDTAAKILICSMYGTPVVKRKALEVGAKSFVSKNVSPEKLLLAIHAVNMGEEFIDANINSNCSHTLLHEELERVSSLSLRELELFRLLAQGKTISYCAKVMNLNDKSIYNLQTKIRENLKIDTLAGLVHLALRHQIIESNVVF
ncbi:MAG: response regulator transcription factor [Limnohabitans sp.]|nr:response regulator transcription factor [Limnohabitans sp.]